MLGNNIRAGLIEAAQYFANKMFAKVDANNLPREIKDATTIQPPEVKENDAYINVEISLKVAPMAAAFEYGSGLHRTKGSPSTYPIRPKNVDFLAFFWDKVDETSPTGRKFRGISSTTGKAIFSFVDHPGVAARPYIVPTLQEEKENIKKILGKAFKADILLGRDRITVIR